jgi:hypothetical protein
MEAQKLLDAAPFAPAVVDVVKQAFEEAWASVAPTIALDRVDASEPSACIDRRRGSRRP